MFTVPEAMPVTVPDVESIVATVVLLLLHLPPVTELDNDLAEPTQTEGVPLIVPAEGNGRTVITAVSVAVPQVEVMV